MVKRRLVLLAASILLTGIAVGHAKLLQTAPAAGAVLKSSPGSLTLTFNEDVRLAVVSLSEGTRDIPLHIDRQAPAAPQVAVPLPALKPGSYQVRWSALSPNDGHVVKGEFTFTIGGGAAASG